jgi:GTP:adenosylcobinamide-phosphate guanylyltransferase
MPTSRYDVIIMAGHDAMATPLSEATGQPCKALIPIAGRPMIHYLIQALQASDCMARLAVVGVSPEEIAPDKATVFVPNQGSLVANLSAALDALQASDPVLVASTDIPLLTPQAVRDLVERCEGQALDLGYPIVERQVMEAQYPGSGRTFVPLVEGNFAGGDLFYLRPPVFRDNAAMFASLSARRKSAWQLARLMGAAIPLRYALKRLRIRDLERRAQRLLRADCRAIISPFAELAMDVDKPHHLELVRRALTPQE